MIANNSTNQLITGKLQAYTAFDKVAKTITFSGFVGTVNDIISITDKTNGRVIFDSVKQNSGVVQGTLVGQVLTLNATSGTDTNTISFANSDLLEILVNVPTSASGASSANQLLANTLSTATNVALADILTELKDDSQITESIWFDKLTPTLFYVRESKVNQDSGNITVSFKNVDGTSSTPTIANLVQAQSSKDIEIVTNKYTANTAGTGYAIGELIEENRLINTADNSIITLWFNKTQNTTIATAPTFANLSQSESIVTTGKTQYIKSTGNSTLTNIAAGATFNGAIIDVLAYPSIIVSSLSDQPLTISVKQYIDSNGSQIVSTSTFTRLAGVGLNTPIKLNGNYAKVDVTNTGSVTSSVFVVDTYLGSMEVLPTELTNEGNLKIGSNVEVIGAGRAGKYSLYRNTALLASVQTIKATKGNIYGLNIINPNNSIVYVKFYDISTVTLGTTTPVETIAVPPLGVYNVEPIDCVFSYFQTDSIKVVAVTGLADSSITAPAVGVLFEAKYV
jgi:hypothetical protein